MWIFRPFATSVKPSISNNAKASIFIVGWQAMNEAIEPEATNITSNEVHTAESESNPLFNSPFCIIQFLSTKGVKQRKIFFLKR